MNMPLLLEQPELKAQAESIINQFGFILTQVGADAGFELGLDHSGLKLYNRDEPKQKPLMVDFVAGANAHRRQFGGGRGQAIAKAAGLKSGANPKVIDGTAGLGKDAFVLASLGCSVTLVERHPVVRALLQDGLKRAYQDPDIGPWMIERMILSEHTHISELAAQQQTTDVVYLDPMYPHEDKAGKNSALVKKDMRTFQSLVGKDEDADQLLKPALELAQKRVVVKRPSHAKYLAQYQPTIEFPMKKNRFDVYVNAAL